MLHLSSLKVMLHLSSLKNYVASVITQNNVASVITQTLCCICHHTKVMLHLSSLKIMLHLSSLKRYVASVISHLIFLNVGHIANFERGRFAKYKHPHIGYRTHATGSVTRSYSTVL